MVLLKMLGLRYSASKGHKPRGAEEIHCPRIQITIIARTFEPMSSPKQDVYAQIIGNPNAIGPSVRGFGIQHVDHKSFNLKLSKEPNSGYGLLATEKIQHVEL